MRQSIWLTLRVSFTGTLIFAVGAIPLAYLLARKSFPLKRLVLGIIDLPVVIPHSAAGIAILGFVSRDSVVGKMGSALGLNFVGHPAGIAVAMAFVSLPYLIIAARDGFAAVPVRLGEGSPFTGRFTYPGVFYHFASAGLEKCHFGGDPDVCPRNERIRGRDHGRLSPDDHAGHDL